MSLEATDIERRLRANRNALVLVGHVSGRSKAWEHFSLIFKKRSDDNDLVELKYTCACNRCLRIYRYKASDGSSYGTKNLIDPIRHYKGSKSGRQRKLMQCMQNKVAISDKEIADKKQREVAHRSVQTATSHLCLLNIAVCVTYCRLLRS